MNRIILALAIMTATGAIFTGADTFQLAHAQSLPSSTLHNTGPHEVLILTQEPPLVLPLRDIPHVDHPLLHELQPDLRELLP